MSLKLVGAATAAALGVGLVLLWGPTAGRRAQAVENQAEQAILRGDVQVSPVELATLMHNRQVDLAIVDLRDEPAFNRFHLLDARRISDLGTLRALPEKTVKMLVAADDDAALAAYRALSHAGTRQVYFLAGGIPAWLGLFAPPSTEHALAAGALGGRHPASFPDLEHAAVPKFEPKVKLGLPGAKKGPGGCGG